MCETRQLPSALSLVERFCPDEWQLVLLLCDKGLDLRGVENISPLQPTSTIKESRLYLCRSIGADFNAKNHHAIHSPAIMSPLLYPELVWQVPATV
jgi:hypothetical protein